MLRAFCIWALCETAEHVMACWLFPVIITGRCLPPVFLLSNWVWQTCQCCTVTERNVLHSILSCMWSCQAWKLRRDENYFNKTEIKHLAVDWQSSHTQQQHTPPTVEAFLTLINSLFFQPALKTCLELWRLLMKSLLSSDQVTELIVVSLAPVSGSVQ